MCKILKGERTNNTSAPLERPAKRPEINIERKGFSHFLSFSYCKNIIKFMHFDKPTLINGSKIYVLHSLRWAWNIFIQTIIWNKFDTTL